MSKGTTNVAEFNRSLKAFRGLTLEAAATGHRKLTLQVQRGVILANPRDTGRMQNSWVVSVGSPSSGVSAEGEFSQAEAMAAALSQALGELRTLRYGQPTFVSNNVEYAGHVNDHHPDKAGFVQAVVENVLGQFEGGVS